MSAGNSMSFAENSQSARLAIELLKASVPPEAADDPQRRLGSGLPRVQRHRRHSVHAHRVVVDEPGGVTRRARRRRRHARVQQLDGEPRRLAVLGEAHRVPEAQARVLRGSDRLDSVRARARRHRVGAPRLVAAFEGAHPRAAVELLLRTRLRLLHRRLPRSALALRGRRGQHLLRDRLPAHRHDVAERRRSTRRRCSPTSTTTSRTRCCAATRSRCSSSTASDRRGRLRRSFRSSSRHPAGAPSVRRQRRARTRRPRAARRSRHHRTRRRRRPHPASSNPCRSVSPPSR